MIRISGRAAAESLRRRCLEARERAAAEARSAPQPPAPANDHAARQLLILACDYRITSVGLEKGLGCGCLGWTRCGLGRGRWADDPGSVDYGDCLACVSSERLKAEG
jgi:hypothetical protein